MASGPQLGDEVRVVRGRGVRRDVWAVVVLGVGVIAALLMIRSGGSEQPVPPVEREVPAASASARAADRPAEPNATAPATLPTTMPRKRAGKLRALKTLGVEPTRGPDGKRQVDAAPVIDALNKAGIHEGIAAFPPPGTDPPKTGVIVPEGIELPEGYVRHYQTTDDGEPLPPILMFHPDYTFTDDLGNPIKIPEDRVVPPDMVPEGVPIQMLEVPARHGSR
jgi:hypothetical protein